MTESTTSAIANIATAIGLFAITATVTIMAMSVAGEDRTLIDGYPACATEDSDNCYWDAERHGNGEGLSFVSIDGEIIPWCTDEIIASEAICWGPLR